LIFEGGDLMSKDFGKKAMKKVKSNGEDAFSDSAEEVFCGASLSKVFDKDKDSLNKNIKRGSK